MHAKYIMKKGRKHGPYFYTTIRMPDGCVISNYLGTNRKEALKKEKELRQVHERYMHERQEHTVSSMLHHITPAKYKRKVSHIIGKRRMMPVFLVLLLIVMGFMAFTLRVPTGLFVPEEYEHFHTIEADASFQHISYRIIFDVYKPANCADGAAVVHDGEAVDFTVLDEKYTNGTCQEVTIQFSNVIFNQTGTATGGSILTAFAAEKDKDKKEKKDKDEETTIETTESTSSVTTTELSTIEQTTSTGMTSSTTTTPSTTIEETTSTIAMEENITTTTETTSIETTALPTTETTESTTTSTTSILEEATYYIYYGKIPTTTTIETTVATTTVATTSTTSIIVNETTSSVMPVTTSINETTTINITTSIFNETTTTTILNLTLNETLNITNAAIPLKLLEMIDRTNVTIGVPVEWIQRIVVEEGNTTTLSVNISEGATGISVRKVVDEQEQIVVDDKIKIRDNGVLKNKGDYEKDKRIEIIDETIRLLQEQKQMNTTLDRLQYADDKIMNLSQEKSDLEGGIIGLLTGWLTAFFTNPIGMVLDMPMTVTNVTEIIIQEPVSERHEIEILYETPGPETLENIVSPDTKVINVTTIGDVHYTDVLAYTKLIRETSAEDNIILTRTTDGADEAVDFVAMDSDANGLIDIIYWVVPSLSTQTYAIVDVSQAPSTAMNVADSIYNVTAENNFTHLSLANSSILVYMPFDENITNNTVYDYSSFNMDSIAIVRANITSQAKYGIAMNFTNVASETDKHRLVLPAMNLNGTNFTISMWLFPYTVGVNQDILAKPTSANTANVKLYIGQGTKQITIRHRGFNMTAYSWGNMTANAWNYVVFTYDGSIATLYVFNPVYRDVLRQEVSGYLNDTSTSPVLASSRGYIQYDFRGIIDEFMIINRSMDETEVNASYAGTFLRFNPRGQQTFQFINFTNNEIFNRVNFTIEAQMLQGTTINATLYASNVTNNTGYINTTDSLIGYWHFDGDVNDASGFGKNGTINGSGVTNSIGLFADAYSFNGSSGNYIQFGNLSANFSSLSLWFYNSVEIASTTAQRTLVKFSQYPIVACFGSCTGNLNNEIICLDGSSSGQNRNGWCSTTGSIPVGWHHFAVNWDGTDYEIYLDGVKKNNCKVGTPTFTSLSNFTISSTSWNGTVDEVILFNRSLSATDVNNLYVTGSANHTNNGVGINWTVVGNEQRFSNATIAGQYAATFDIENLNGYNFIMPEAIFYSNVNNSYSPIMMNNATVDIFSNITVDETPPTITVISPMNNSNTNSSIVLFNASTNENASWCGLSINGSANMTLTLDANNRWANYTNYSMADGNYTFIITCNDTSNNNGSSSAYNLLVDTVSPKIEFSLPTLGNGAATGSNWLFVNVSTNDTSSISTFIDFDNSLLGWWRFDDVNATGDPQDYTQRNNGTKNGTTVQVQNGHMGKAFNFSGAAGDFINITSTGLDFRNQSNYTWVAWIYPISASVSLISKCDANCWLDMYGVGYTVGIDSSSHLVVDDHYDVSASSSGAVSLNAWNYIAVTYANQTGTFYINGEPSGTYNLTIYGYLGDSLGAAENIYIGMAHYGGSMIYNAFSGKIDDVMIFNTTLTFAEITALHANTSAKYYSNNYTGLAAGTHTFTSYAQDVAGNVNSTARTVTIDITMPAVAAHNLTYEYPSNVSVLFNFTDNVATDSFSANDTTNFEINRTGSLFNKTFLKPMFPALYWLNITANDTANNAVSVEIWINITDTAKPVITTYNVSREYPALAGAWFNATDNYLIDNWSTNETAKFGINATGYLTNVTNLAPATYWITVKLNDTLNNTIFAEIRIPINDTTTPTIVTYNVSREYPENPNAWFNFTDNYVWDNWSTNETGKWGINKTGYLMNITDLPPATYWIQVKLNDTMNNTAYAEIRIPINDTTLPVITTYNISREYPDNVTGQFNFTDNYLTDSFSVNETIKFKINKTGFFENLTNLVPATYWILITANDTKNNTITSVINVVINDTTKPTIPTYNISREYPDNVTGQFNFTDNYLTDTFTINETTKFKINKTGYFENQTDLPPATYWIKITANDTLNNTVSSVVNVVINDTTPPAVTVHNLTYEYPTQVLVLFNFTDNYGTDTMSMNDTISFSMNKTGYLQNITRLTPAKSFRLYWLNVVANDTLNNTRSVIVWANVTDATAPAITDARNITVNDTDWTYHDFNATDNYLIDSFSVNNTGNFSIDATTGELRNATHLEKLSVIWLDVVVNDTLNNTETVSIFVNVTEANLAPNTTTPTMLPVSAFTNTTLNATTTATDDDLTNNTIVFRWYVNGNIVYVNYAYLVVNGTTPSQTLLHTNFTKYDNITVEVWADDGTVNSTFRNSTTKQIQNWLTVAPTLVNPGNNTNKIYTNDTIYWANTSSLDADEDVHSYELLIATNNGFATANLLFNDTITSLNYTNETLPDQTLQNSLYWRVRSWDGNNYSVWSSFRNISVVQARIAFISPSNNLTTYPGISYIILLNETNHTEWTGSVMLHIANDDANGTYTMTAGAGNTWTYTYAVSGTLTPRTLSLRAYGYNGTTENITTFLNLRVTRLAGTAVGAPNITMMRPNVTNTLPNSTVNVTLKAVLETALAELIFNVTYPNGTTWTLNPTYTEDDGTNFRFNRSYIVNATLNGTYTLDAIVGDVSGQVRHRYEEIFAHENHTLNISAIGVDYMEILDKNSEHVFANGTSNITAALPYGKYDVYMVTSYPSVILRNITLNNNISSIFSYNNTAEDKTPPRNRRSVDQFLMSSTTDYESVDFEYNYASLVNTVAEEDNLELWRYNITNEWEEKTVSIYKGTDKLNATLSNLSYFLIAEAAAPVVVVSHVSGGGESRQYISTGGENYQLDMIVPALLSMGSNDKINAPVIIHNTAQYTNMSNISISAYTKTGDLSFKFTRDKWDYLGHGQKTNTTLIIYSHSEPGQYNVTLTAVAYALTVSGAQKITTSRIMLIDLTPRAGPLATIYDNLIFARNLFAENPECYELSEMLSEAEVAINKTEAGKAANLVDSAVNACRDLMRSLGKEMRLPERKIDLMFIAVIVAIGSFGLLVYLYVRNVEEARKKPRSAIAVTRKFMCKHCGKYFDNEDSLHRHEKHVHGMK